jgi:hypothetical protein
MNECGYSNCGDCHDDLNTFIDMFELYPIYSCLFDLPIIEMIQLSDGGIISNTWKTMLKGGSYWF